MYRTLVIDVVGLTPALLGPNTPHLSRLVASGAMRPLRSVTPAVTATVQSTLVTGLEPSGHGAVANGWYFRDLAEILFWRQSNHLVGGEKVWEAARCRDASFTCAKLFWWYNMYSSADYTITPRPMYPADGRKLPDTYTHPSGLRDELNQRLGQFPLFNFWGPTADIVSTRWIGDATAIVDAKYSPTLTLVYLPHLDYDLQRYGPNDARIGEQVRLVDEVCGRLIEAAERDGVRVLVVSEYGMSEVSGVVNINRVLRRAGWLKVREELGRELLDAGASDAFAVADHQLAHVYVARPELVAEVKSTLESLPGIERVLDAESKREFGLDHPRSGELVAISRKDRWFTYYYWLDDDRAPDFARTVEIHRKPGYDPVELFLDPTLVLPKAQVAWRLAKKMAGFRTLMDVIPLDSSLVRGSHGRPADDPSEGPLVIGSHAELLPEAETLDATDFKALMLRYLFESRAGNASLREAS